MVDKYPVRRSNLHNVREQIGGHLEDIDDRVTAIEGGTPLPSGTWDFIDFTTNLPDPVYKEGRLFYDETNKCMSFYNEEEDIILQVGQELFIRVYNASGSLIGNGKPVSVTGLTAGAVPQIGLADATSKTSAQAYIGLTTHDVEDASYGYVTMFGFVRDMDTSTLTAGSPCWLDPDVVGGITTTEPESPAWLVRVGGVAKSDATTGMIFSRPVVGNNTEDTRRFFNGSILESATLSVTSDGATCTVSLEDSVTPTDPLSLLFNEEFHIVAAPHTATLTAGTDTVPVRNWVYFPESTKVLTVSLTGFPASEQFVPVADIIVQSAASAQTDGFYKVHAWTDHLSGSTGQGHLSHLNEWIRNRPAAWISGCVITPSAAEGAAVANLDLQYTSGVIYQLHRHTMPVFNSATGDPFFVWNDPTTPYKNISDINTTDISVDALGNTLNNKVYSLVIWGVVSEDDNDCQVYINLPSGSYTTESGGIADANNTAAYSLPEQFLGTSFLLSRLVMRNQAGNVEIVSGGTFDLRGLIPAASGGVSGGSGVVNFTELLDTPSDYIGNASKILTVNSAETGVQFSTPVIDDSGKLGIGQTAPTHLLHVGDSATAASQEIRLERNAAQDGIISIGFSDTNISMRMRVDSLEQARIEWNGWATPTNDPLIFADIANGERMRIDSAGNVGIGTASPAELLSIGDYSVNDEKWISIGKYFNQSSGIRWAAGSSITENDATIYVDGSENLNITYNGRLTPLGSYVRFLSGTSEKMRIDSDGHVGIGVIPADANSSSDFLQVGYGAIQSNSAVNIQILQNASYNNSLADEYIVDGTASRVLMGGYFRWYTAPTGLAGDPITFTERMRLDADGNLGIGTTPTRLLHVSGDTPYVRIQDSNATTDNLLEALLEFSNSTNTRKGYIGFSGTGNPNFTLANDITTGVINLSTGGAERMRITSTGSVGIGTTNPYAQLHATQSFQVGAPQATYGTSVGQLKVTGAGNVGILVESGAASSGYITFSSDTASLDYRLQSNAGQLLFIGSDTAEDMRINSAGNVGIGISAPTAKLEVLATTETASVFVSRNAAQGIKMWGDGTANYIRSFSGSSKALIISEDSGAGIIKFENPASSERMRITSAGNVGIGATAPDSLLEVKVSSTQPLAKFSSSNHNAALYIDSNTSSEMSINVSADSDGTLAAKNLVLYTGSSNPRVTLDFSGDVGIGTTSPDAKLDVNGGVLVGAAPTGGDKGIGTVNVSGGYYVNGAAISAGTVDDTPVDGATTTAISSNWAFDHGQQVKTNTGGTTLYPTFTSSSTAGINKSVYLDTALYWSVSSEVLVSRGGFQPSSTADVLDDYEEGTWTPTLQDGTRSNSEGQTYSKQVGQYTKIGDTVFIDGYLLMTSLGSLTTSQQAFIAGLPFTPANATDIWNSIVISGGFSLAITAGVSLVGQIGTETGVNITQWDATSGTSIFTIAELTLNGGFRLSGHYKAA